MRGARFTVIAREEVKKLILDVYMCISQYSHVMFIQRPLRSMIIPGSHCKLDFEPD